MNLFKELKNRENYIEILQDYNEKKKELSEEFNIDLLIKSLDTYSFSEPRLALIPKANKTNEFREIYIFSENDSFLLKVINSIFFKNHRGKINKNVYSYLSGVKAFDASKNIQSCIREHDMHFIKLDISNFFLSVNKETIFKAIDELVEDTEGRDLLLKFFNLDKYEYKGEIINRELSLMPGSALSSFFANYVLRDIDEYLESECLCYCRYSDDLMIGHSDTNILENIFEELKTKLIPYGLIIKDSKTTRYNPNDILTFLGLDITKSYIDISANTFINTKKFIKSLCKSYVVRSSKNGVKKNYRDVERCISEINRSLYKSFLSEKLEHSHGRVRYLFSNITTYKTLRELDFYIKDQLRYVFTHKHNKGNAKQITSEDLKVLGNVSLVQMYNLYRMDRDVYLNEVYLMLHKNRYSEVIKIDKAIENIKPTKELSFTGSFEDLYNHVVESNGRFISNGLFIRPEYVIFNLDEKTIKLNNQIISRDNNLLVKEIMIELNNEIALIHLKENRICNNLTLDEELLMTKYIRSSFKEQSILSGNYYETYKPKQYFRQYGINSLYLKFSLEELKANVSYPRRYSDFISYLFFRVLCGSFIKSNREFIKIKMFDVTLVIKNSWISD
jgi:hypothetical protein